RWIGCCSSAVAGPASPAPTPPRSACSAARRDTPLAGSGAIGRNFNGLLIGEVYDVSTSRSRENHEDCVEERSEDEVARLSGLRRDRRCKRFVPRCGLLQ